jgi:hypothetical protein
MHRRSPLAPVVKGGMTNRRDGGSIVNNGQAKAVSTPSAGDCAARASTEGIISSFSGWLCHNGRGDGQ